MVIAKCDEKREDDGKENDDRERPSNDHLPLSRRLSIEQSVRRMQGELELMDASVRAVTTITAERSGWPAINVRCVQ